MQPGRDRGAGEGEPDPVVARTDPPMVRCEPCLGLGYKGRSERGSWKIRPCRSCGGTGQRRETDRQLTRVYVTCPDCDASFLVRHAGDGVPPHMFQSAAVPRQAGGGPMTITITIQCDNAAFDPECEAGGPADEIARILKDYARKLREGRESPADGGCTLRDISGNRVGQVKITE